MQVGLDIVTSANCKSQLQFQQTNNYQLLYLTSTTYFNQQRLSADGILIPNLHKALLVGCKLNRPLCMDEKFKTYYQNPKVDFLFGYFGGDPTPTKQDKFQRVAMTQVNEDGTEEILNNFYVRKPDQSAIQEFNNYIQELAKRNFNDNNKIVRPNEVEVVLSFTITEKRYKTVDVDNLAKAVLDSLNNIAFEDDSQVVSLICSKHIHPLKLNGLLIAITKLTGERQGLGGEIKLFTGSQWK